MWVCALVCVHVEARAGLWVSFCVVDFFPALSLDLSLSEPDAQVCTVFFQ